MQRLLKVVEMLLVQDALEHVVGVWVFQFVRLARLICVPFDY